MAIILWPVVPLFWIPIHALPRISKRVGLLTYLMPTLIWLYLAYMIYIYRDFILSLKTPLPVWLNMLGIILLSSGTLLHIWTGWLLGLWGLIGLPEISLRLKGRLVTEGPFSVIRHPTYLAHTLMFLGVFLLTGIVAVGILALLDFTVVTTIIIPLEERELSGRFGREYEIYKGKVQSALIPWLRAK